VVRLRMLQSMQRMADRAFSHPRLSRLVAWPVLFLGAPAERTSAMYSLMSYADMALGTWYPQGGMHQVIEAMVKVATSLGVTFRLGEEVTSIALTSGRATGLRTATGELVADAVVAAADYHHVEQHLLPPKARQFSAAWWDRRTMSPSSLLFYLGLDTEVALPHHTLFFDRDLDRHMSEVYDRPRWPEEPLFYACVPSVSDRTVAPSGCGNLFLLVPLAAGLRDDAQARERIYGKVMRRLEQHLGRPLAEHVVVKRSYAMRDFIADHGAYKGNAYGMANTLRQTGPLKPPLRSRKVPGLYFAGQLTVPGPGMPPSLVSGELAAGVVHQDLMASRRR
jgi:phytoene desaturase